MNTPINIKTTEENTEVLEKLKGISQHGPRWTRYTWYSDYLTSLIRHKNTFAEAFSGHNLLIQLKFLLGECLFQVWKQKAVVRS